MAIFQQKSVLAITYNEMHRVLKPMIVRILNDSAVSDGQEQVYQQPILLPNEELAVMRIKSDVSKTGLAASFTFKTKEGCCIAKMPSCRIHTAHRSEIYLLFVD
ncbi:hypothetical protein [Xanthomonas phage JGB6]|nr:hypothetical protein [Xanthomonas phage JGB6]